MGTYITADPNIIVDAWLNDYDSGISDNPVLKMGRNLTNMKTSIVFLVISLLSIGNLEIISPAQAFESTSAICNTGEQLIFTRKIDGDLTYTAYKGKYNPKQPIEGEPKIRPELVLHNGQVTLLNNGNKQSMVWKNRRYTYQLVVPTLKAEANLSGQLIIKKNDQIILKKQCRNYSR
jgi:hypothetical protein